jgi:Mn-dependent DtxR family transcriptional regulator
LDRLPTNRLTVTHELMAAMLGVRRESITESAHKLRTHGVIDCCRGHITVSNRRTLELLTCECYSVVKKETDRLLPKLALALPVIWSGASAKVASRPVSSIPRDRIRRVTQQPQENHRQYA